MLANSLQFEHPVGELPPNELPDELSLGELQPDELPTGYHPINFFKWCSSNDVHLYPGEPRYAEEQKSRTWTNQVESRINQSAHESHHEFGCHQLDAGLLDYQLNLTVSLTAGSIKQQNQLQS